MSQRTTSATFLALILAVLGATVLSYVQGHETVRQIERLSQGVMLMSMEMSGMLELEYESIVNGKSKTIRVRVVREGDESDSDLADRLQARVAEMEERYPPA